MTELLVPIVLASLAGSLHCAAMCGPFVAAVAGVGTREGGGVAVQAGYHLGRLVTYVTLGAGAGFVGGALDLAGHRAGVGRASAIVAGAILVLWGASALVVRDKLVRLTRRAPRARGAWLARVLARIKNVPPVPRAVLLGLATTLVPCGWLYAFLATAGGTGRVLAAAAVMAAFWVGTVPALVLAAFGLRGLAARFGEKARVVSGGLIVASGVLLLVLRLGAPAGPAVADGNAAAMPASCPLHGHSR